MTASNWPGRNDEYPYVRSSWLVAACAYEPGRLARTISFASSLRFKYSISIALLLSLMGSGVALCFPDA